MKTNINTLRQLLYSNWIIILRMDSRIGKKGNYIPLRIVFPILLAWLVAEVCFDFSYLKLYGLFTGTIVMADSSRLYNKGWLDWMHCFFLKKSDGVKFILLFVIDLLTPRVIILFAYSLPLILFSDRLVFDLSTLLLVYFLLSASNHFALLLSNRKKLIRVLYKWFSMILIPFCIGISGLSFYKMGNDEGITRIKGSFADFYIGNHFEITVVLITAFAVVFVVLILYSLKVYCTIPFIREFNDFNRFF